MPYQALRSFTVIPKGTENVINYRPGEAILDFRNWPSEAQRVHLSQGLVERTEPLPSPVPQEDVELDGAEDDALADPPKPKRGRPPKAKADDDGGDAA